MTSTGASGASDSEESGTDQYEPIRKLAMVQLQPPRNPNKPFTAFSIKDILGHRHTSSDRESNGDQGSEHTEPAGFEPNTGNVVVVSVTDDDDDTNTGRTTTLSPPSAVITKSHTNPHNNHNHHHYHHHHHHHHHNQQHNHYKSHGNSNNISSGKSSPVGIISTETSLRLISHNNNNNNNNSNNSNNNNSKRVSLVLTNNKYYLNEKDHYHHHQQQNTHHHHPQSRLHNHHNHLHPHHPKSTTIGTPSPPPASAPPTPPTPPTPQLQNNNNNSHHTPLKSPTHHHQHHHDHHLQHQRGTLVLGTTTTTTNSATTNSNTSSTTTSTTTTINGARIVRPWDTGPESDNNTSSDIDGDEEINVDDDTPIPSIVKTVSPLDALMEMANKTFEGLETSDTVDAKRREQAALFGKHQPPKKRRKSRTAFTNQQIYELEKRFLYQKYLTPADRDEIALSLGLTNAQVITWFQNRRAKLKRDLEEMKNDVEHAKVVTPQLNSLLVKTLVKKSLECDPLTQQAIIEEEEEGHSKDNSVTS